MNEQWLLLLSTLHFVCIVYIVTSELQCHTPGAPACGLLCFLDGPLLLLSTGGNWLPGSRKQKRQPKLPRPGPPPSRKINRDSRQKLRTSPST